MLRKWYLGSLFIKLLGAHVLVVIITLLAVSLFFSYMVEKYFFSAREWELTTQAVKVAEVLGEEMQKNDYAEVEKVAYALAVSLDVKIRVMGSDPHLHDQQSIVAIPQPGDAETMIGLEESEIEHVLQGNSLSKKVFGPEMQRLLVAIPVFEEKEEEVEETAAADSNPEEVIGVVTVSAPLVGVKATVAQVSRLITYSGILAALVAGILALSLSKTISHPLRVMTRAARELVKGNYRSRIDVRATGEMKELADTFNQAVDEMEKTVEEQKRLQELRQNLLASVSHEFRVPLTSIQGFAEAILDGFVEEEEKEKYIQIILENTIHVKRLVNDLLELSSIESGNIQLYMQKVSPVYLLEKAANSMQPKAQEKNIDLICNYDQAPKHLWGDEDRLYQILINLLENAITHMPAAGQIKLAVHEKEGQAVFSVSDNGPGIPQEDIPYIFERFYKVDKSRNRTNRGKGLGLAIVKELVHLHGGRVSVESMPGEGSTFYVNLPVKVQHI